jgi:hypothetical protein
MFPFLVTHELHDEVIEERRDLFDVNVSLSNDMKKLENLLELRLTSYIMNSPIV